MVIEKGFFLAEKGLMEEASRLAEEGGRLFREGDIAGGQTRLEEARKISGAVITISEIKSETLQKLQELGIQDPEPKVGETLGRPVRNRMGRPPILNGDLDEFMNRPIDDQRNILTQSPTRAAILKHLFFNFDSVLTTAEISKIVDNKSLATVYGALGTLKRSGIIEGTKMTVLGRKREGYSLVKDPRLLAMLPKLLSIEIRGEEVVAQSASELEQPELYVS